MTTAGRARMVWPILLVGGWLNWAAIHFVVPELWFVDVMGVLGLLVFLVLASALPQLQLFGAAISRAPARTDAVALTFDDGPHPEFTPAILDALAAAGAKATFFLVGERAAAHPGVARAIADRGHQVAFHGHRHKVHLMFSPHRFAADYREGMDAVLAATGRLPRFFRPPIGLITPPVVGTVEAWRGRVAAWAVRPFDGGGAPSAEISRRVLSKVRGGDIVLLHDAPPVRAPAAVPSALAALPAILEGLTDKGLQAVTLADLTGEPAYLEDAIAAAARTARPRRTLLEWGTVATIALLAFGAFTGAAGAAEVEPVAAAEGLPASFHAAARDLAVHATVQSTFEQRKTSILFAEDVVRTGTLRLRRADGRLLWTYDGGPALLMADGRFYPAGKTLEEAGAGAKGFDMPGAAEMAEVFQALFRLDPEELARHFHGEVVGPGVWSLHPTRAGAAALFGSVRLEVGGEPKALRRVTMDEATGDRTVISFADVRVGEPLSVADFMTPAERSASARSGAEK